MVEVVVPSTPQKMKAPMETALPYVSTMKILPQFLSREALWFLHILFLKHLLFM